MKVTVLSDASGPALVLSFLPAFATAAELPAKDAERLARVVEGLLRFTLEQAYPDDDLGEIEVTLEAGDGIVYVEAHDWGLPLTSAGSGFGALPPPLAVLTPDAEDVQLLNLGADGKRLIANVRVGVAGDRAAKRHHVDAAPRRLRGADRPDAIAVRSAGPEDAESIAQLLYENYHLSYVHAEFYRPRLLMEELATGRLISTIALHEGRVVGHHALMPTDGVPSAETGAAVIHSAYRGLGIFGRLFERTLAKARERGFASVFGDAVTIHPFSQRVELSHGYRETALEFGMVPARTTMRGFDGEGPHRRTATLRSYRLFDERPRPVALPSSYRKLLESIYDNLGLTIVRREEPGEVEGDAVATDDDESRALGFLRLRRWHRGADTELKQAVRHLVSRHNDVVYADVDLTAVEDVDAAVECLNELGFFAGGLLVHGPDGHDHARLQLMNCEHVELGRVVCESPFAQELKSSVLADKARVDA